MIKEDVLEKVMHSCGISIKQSTTLADTYLVSKSDMKTLGKVMLSFKASSPAMTKHDLGLILDQLEKVIIPMQRENQGLREDLDLIRANLYQIFDRNTLAKDKFENV